uniref:Ciliary neurotrophic factor n=1 Tax=Romanomermis culicivorax TaxID=13658 RepID=A0A915J3M0_ROMCU
MLYKSTGTGTGTTVPPDATDKEKSEKLKVEDNKQQRSVTDWLETAIPSYRLKSLTFYCSKIESSYEELRKTVQERESPTHWNSLLDMLQQLLELKELSGVYMMEESLDWTVLQWSIIEKLITFLQPFKDATEKFLKASELKVRLQKLVSCSVQQPTS